MNTISNYAAVLRPLLSAKAFAPARSRLLWLPVHWGVIALASVAIIRGWVPWTLACGLSLLIGASFAGLTFVGHEALHGALVRRKPLRRLIGWITFLPFAVSPRLWEAWHNRTHHGHTNCAGADPDAYPTLSQYHESRITRQSTDWVAPGRGRLAGVFSLLFGFSVQSTHMLVTAAKTKLLCASVHRRALFETGLAWALWLALAVAIGPARFTLVFGIPLLIGNAIVMSLILTNHSLSPLTPVNDPLVNSLSVSGPRVIEWLTLGFGYHVEHHLFPAMSARHAPELSRLLRRLWPDRYQSLPYFSALAKLHSSPRVYKDDVTLIDPKTGATTTTLGSNGPSGSTVETCEPAKRREICRLGDVASG